MSTEETIVMMLLYALLLSVASIVWGFAFGFFGPVLGVAHGTLLAAWGRSWHKRSHR